MGFMEKYNAWLNDDNIDAETKTELKSIADDQDDIKDRFYTDLEFGTGGLRGVVGAGTNRMNKYTVAKATQGLANYLIKNSNGKELSAVIAFDSRNMSTEFSKTAALVFCANGIKTYLFESLRSTPELSHAIRHLGTDTGIVVTASHNPPEYNGYKAYGNDGSQLLPDAAGEVVREAKEVGGLENVKMISEEDARINGLLKIIGGLVDDVYIEKVKKQRLREDIDRDISIVYTPLNGAGNIPVRRVLKEVGFTNVHAVELQTKADPMFTTIGYPNPEDPKSFTLSIELGKKVGADILVATDPDSDRIGLMTKDNKGEYQIISGNDTGALLLDYVLSAKKYKGILAENGAVVKTIVTSEIGRKVAEYYGLKAFDTLTGFKFIASEIRKFEQTGDYKYEFGYEESFGYLPWTTVRDKDGILSAMLACEMAAYYKSHGKTLLDALDDIHKRVGYFVDDSYSLKLVGIEGQEKIADIMDEFRHKYKCNINGSDLAEVHDYLEGTIKDIKSGKSRDTELFRENVMKYIFENESWYAVRPSGTEPKLKFYISARGNSEKDARDKVEAIKSVVDGRITELL